MTARTPFPPRRLARPLALALLVVGFSALLLGRAQAGGGHYYPPVADPVVREECGSCHLAFAPSMLPARSWQKMMGELQNHFGDDASVEPATARRIADYLVANAGDSAAGRPYAGKLLRGVPPEAAPQRISELPKWRKEHREVPDWEWRHKEVRTRANCLACHTAADRGDYSD